MITLNHKLRFVAGIIFLALPAIVYGELVFGESVSAESQTKFTINTRLPIPTPGIDVAYLDNVTLDVSPGSDPALEDFNAWIFDLGIARNFNQDFPGTNTPVIAYYALGIDIAPDFFELQPDPDGDCVLLRYQRAISRAGFVTFTYQISDNLVHWEDANGFSESITVSPIDTALEIVSVTIPCENFDTSIFARISIQFNLDDS